MGEEGRGAMGEEGGGGDEGEDDSDGACQWAGSPPRLSRSRLSLALATSVGSRPGRVTTRPVAGPVAGVCYRNSKPVKMIEIQPPGARRW